MFSPKVGNLEYTFFLSCSAAEFNWTDSIKIVHKYGERLSDEQVQVMDWSIKVSHLKRNPATVAWWADYVFNRFGLKLF